MESYVYLVYSYLDHNMAGTITLERVFLRKYRAEEYVSQQPEVEHNKWTIQRRKLG